MLDKIILFSIRHKAAVGILTLVLIVWGIWSASKLPIDAVPDITNNQVQVITNAPTLAAQEVEQFITYPIEQSLANLPDVEEVRSISRFGLSVITIVFEDQVDIYFARQLIAEKLREAEEKIPGGLGRPEMAPVSTGLGEIYQYVLHPAKGSEQKYSAADLRSMQDWIVARQLHGTKGVAEVNSFGGLLKQYEVAVDPERLRAMDVTLPELFAALEKNNQNTGGAYIDKRPNAYFIRSVGLATSLDDIRNTVVKHSDAGIPLLVKDIARVGFGSATRYGAVTYNGEKEVVGGIVMMLKGENSAAVVSRVKEKMKMIQKALPSDVIIEPFLDRTDLVNRAISTVERNLIEGALIVIFVLVLFLGNLRAGLIVASAIPLAMLFALGMMRLFGVSANLMSLGAIDFGLIVDGAVIIVEATMHFMAVRAVPGRLTQTRMDGAVFESASRIRNSAAFGEIIIMIVYIPILTLTGIEGKMFRPMAETVSFAILGALLLSLTYIPMMCALFLPKQWTGKPTFSDRMMVQIQRVYQPLLRAAIKAKYAVLLVSGLCLGLAIWLFMRLGGEFIPQLQEGDYAFHCILPQGASLSQSIETSMQASRIIRSFPEVEEVVGKTGSAEVPTDPMPPEASDLIIVLKPKKEWTTTKDYNELAERIEAKLKVIPGVFFEINQPIQMRFNELMTGVRQDVAVKVFGENIDTLAVLASKVAAVIRSVKGVADPQIEQTTGLPQITIAYDRLRMASYGLHIADVNDLVSAAFAGRKTGVIFENERRFDLVVRLDTVHRTSLEDVQNLYIPLHNGTQIPLRQVATIAFKEGPAQISRESGRRRIVVGFNVQGRDVQSAVKEIQQKLDQVLKLPEGYYYTYGGTFENLEKASGRLRIAVPVALLLIFSLLYFTFRSFRQALLIFTAIPMAAIGGVFALVVRGMPFSISAGIGFIALFGVAVLNGIVLISTFNQLEKDGSDDILQRVLEGTSIRLRPVLMTAAVASLGFLPMAVSGGAGAEVQRPLATVVIGGLITATFLTLIVLPILYLVFTRRKVGKQVLATAVLLLCGLFAQAQSPVRLPFQSVLDTAQVYNPQMRIGALQVQKAQTLKGTGFNVDKTGLFAENEDLRPGDAQGILKIGVSQSIEWPGVYTARNQLLQQQFLLSQSTRNITAAELRRDLALAYYQLWYLQERRVLLTELDSIYTVLSKGADLRVRAGEAAGLEGIAAAARQQELSVQLTTIEKDMAVQQQNMARLIHVTAVYEPEDRSLEQVQVDTTLMDPDTHPLLVKQNRQVAIAAASLKMERRQLLPEFSGRFFSQRLYGVADRYSGFSVSVGVPLFAGAHTARIRAAKLEGLIQQEQLEADRLQLLVAYRNAVSEWAKQQHALQYYEHKGLQQARDIISAATLAWKGGELSFPELSQYLAQAIDIRKAWLETLNQYNAAAIHLNYYLNR